MGLARIRRSQLCRPVAPLGVRRGQCRTTSPAFVFRQKTHSRSVCYRCADENRCPQACSRVLAGFSGTGDLVCAPRVLCRHDLAPAAAGGGISPKNPRLPGSGSVISRYSRTSCGNRRSSGDSRAPSSLHGKHGVLVIARRRSKPARNDTAEFMSAETSTTVYSGLAAAPGRASGKAYVIRDAEDIMAVPAGCILVLRILHPHLAPLLPRVAV